MEKPIKRAFVYMFKDEDWKYKVSILIALSFILLFLTYSSQKIIIFVPLQLFISFVVSGYFMKTANKVMLSDYKDNNLLPQWEDNFLSYCLVGFKFFVAMLLLVLAAGLIMFLFSISKLFILGIMVFLIYGFFYFALMNVFCTEFKITSLFEFKKAYEIIKLNVKRYLLIQLIIFCFPLALFLILSFLLTAIMFFVKMGAMSLISMQKLNVKIIQGQGNFSYYLLIFSLIYSLFTAVLNFYFGLVNAYFIGIVRPQEMIETKSND